jgi:hypothetical protein
MADPFFLQLPQAVQSWTTVAAIIAGGAWALYRFGLTRERETAIATDATYTCRPYEGNYLVAFDISMENKGHVRVDAKKCCGPAYKDTAEEVRYSANLLIRRVEGGLAPGQEIHWYPTAQRPSPMPGDIEIDLLRDHKVNGATQFWMEPSEPYHLTSAIVLAPGVYLCVFTFIGDRGTHEFWRRVFVVDVPQVLPRANGAVIPAA